MKAIGYKQPHALDQAGQAGLADITLPDPTPTGHDLLVEVKAISVNPVDTKVRTSTAPAEGQQYKVLGYDASGIVRAVGPDV
ncbi:MAG: alcohol dehydrogenase catalytic domain-containing protein, partial [Polaromonas sp.]